MTTWHRDRSPVERQTLPSIASALPSIQSITNSKSTSPPSAGVSPASSSNHSPAQSSSTGGRDSGNWSMTSASNQSSYSSPMTLAPISNEKPGRAILNPEPVIPEQQQSSPTTNPPFPQQNGHVQSSSTSTHISNSSITNFQSSYPNAHVLTSSYNHADYSPSASRRSSFDTRLGNLALGSPHSGTPAASSQVSLASQLQRERSGGHHQSSPAPSILDHQYQGNNLFNPISSTAHFNSASSTGSNSNRNTGSSWTSVSTSAGADRPGTKNAPPIVGSSRYPYPHPNAPSPTKGFPYAFPDPDVAAGPPGSRDGLTAEDGRSSSFSSQQPPTSLHPKNPYGPQINHFPPGQPQQSQTSLYSQTSNSTTASSQVHPTFSQGSLQDIHHHHHLQRMDSQGTADSPPSTPYSRTPELRVSHKLAERKRRKEMKELFDELRDSLPAERGGKSSKWEVLTKAIEYISQIKQINENMTSKNENLKVENEQLRAELNSFRSVSHQQNGQMYGGQQPHLHTMNGQQNMRTAHPVPVQPHYPSQQGHRLPSMPQDHGNQMQGIERSGY